MDDLLASVEPLIPGLRRYTRSLMRDIAAADDVVQDCLERVIRHWGTRRDEADTASWVFAIAHNLAINRLRQGAGRGRHVPIEDVDESELIVPATQDQALEHRDLLRALDKLPDEQRSVLLLVGVEDFSYAEAARTLQVPMGTVMSRLSRGRARLARMLQEGHCAQEGPRLKAVE